MDDARLQRRILVVVVTTRAAANSLRPMNGQVRAAVQRGTQLLDGIADEVAHDGDAATRQQLDQAKLDLASLLDEG
jgi:hypothetical protein